MLRAVGIDVSARDCKVSWEQFLKIQQMMRLSCDDKAQQMQFAVKLFDPQLSGCVKFASFEKTIGEFFASSDSESDAKGPSFSQSLLKQIKQTSAYHDGYLHPAGLLLVIQ